MRSMNAAAAIALTASLIFGLSTSLSIAQTDQDYGWMWNYGLGMGGMMFGGGLLMLIFWGGIIVLIVLLARWISGFGSYQLPAGGSRQTPLDILQERFARGEIDQQEYDERKRTLSSS